LLKVALTGGIASGKTTVSDMFAVHGVPIIDADLLAREAVEKGSAGLARVIERFGEQIIDDEGNLDRAALRAIVFKDDAARHDLEAIIHPIVRQLTQQRMVTAEADGAPYCITVIPLLAESGRQNQYDHVVVVDVDEETQLQRLLQRDGNSEAQSRRIIASQASRDERLKIADYVIENHSSDTLDDLQARVEALHQTFCTLSNA
jgi:dephospho-CoA kinase